MACAAPKKIILENLIDSHYFHLPSQGNIYTLTNLDVANGPNKVLVASLKREIFCLEYQESSGTVIPMHKEVSFTYIPSGAEIISLDAFNKSSTKNEFVIGITIIKNNTNTESLEYYLNIYSEWEESDDFNLDNIAQNCLALELNFIPYHLTHTELVNWENDSITSKGVVFVLTGSDNQFHVYREHKQDHLYKELENKELFPEAFKNPSPIIWVDFLYNKDYTERFTAQGCECGYVRFTRVCTKTNKVVYNFSTKLYNHISQVKLYYDKKTGCLNMVVVGSILCPVLFENILTYGLSKYHCLPREEYACVATSCLIADFDFDGEDEILISNTAEEITYYKIDPEIGWCMEDLKVFPAPIHKILMADIMGDGVKELVALSTKGVHFLQYDFSTFPDTISKKIEETDVSKILEILSIKD